MWRKADRPKVWEFTFVKIRKNTNRTTEHFLPTRSDTEVVNQGKSHGSRTTHSKKRKQRNTTFSNIQAILVVVVVVFFFFKSACGSACAAQNVKRTRIDICTISFSSVLFRCEKSCSDFQRCCTALFGAVSFRFARDSHICTASLTNKYNFKGTQIMKKVSEWLCTVPCQPHIKPIFKKPPSCLYSRLSKCYISTSYYIEKRIIKNAKFFCKLYLALWPKAAYGHMCWDSCSEKRKISIDIRKVKWETCAKGVFGQTNTTNFWGEASKRKRGVDCKWVQSLDTRCHTRVRPCSTNLGTLGRRASRRDVPSGQATFFRFPFARFIIRSKPKATSSTDENFSPTAKSHSKTALVYIAKTNPQLHVCSDDKMAWKGTLFVTSPKFNTFIDMKPFLCKQDKAKCGKDSWCLLLRVKCI